ncbi:MAG TPA: alpha/beta fold hydrolase [Solirubrobacteraceae bacterium]|nr:alpha/beta fold hydrolase [Solirubrobacteraceae bacterium]
MAWLSDNSLFEALGTRALFLAPYGGADLGECRQAVRRVGGGGVDEWHREWTATADWLVEAGDSSFARGHVVSAREAYLRSATYYRVAYAPLFGAPIDPRVNAGFDREAEAFAKAAPLWDTPVELVEIPFEGDFTLPGVMVRAAGGREARATIVHVNGYDSNLHEMFAAHVPAAVSRGYNLLLFDGPGQGRNLIRDGLTMRPDWENVVRPVIDYALSQPDVDERRVVLAGWSWGGLLAPRATAFEDRIAALWADPGQWDQRDQVLPMLPLSDEEKARFPEGVDPNQLAGMEERLRSADADPMVRWRIIQRGLWVHGKDTLFDYLADVMRYELSSVAGNIKCPTLLTAAEGDPASAGAAKLFEAVAADRKALIRFTEAEGSGGHCEGTARRLFHQRCYDWLDETLG